MSYKFLLIILVGNNFPLINSQKRFINKEYLSFLNFLDFFKLLFSLYYLYPLNYFYHLVYPLDRNNLLCNPKQRLQSLLEGFYMAYYCKVSKVYQRRIFRCRRKIPTTDERILKKKALTAAEKSTQREQNYRNQRKKLSNKKKITGTKKER